ncbi:Kae1-associated kinase Bud32 [Candidatus Bathyarchaeota archaeon]|nr:MAG: Kae1-associated kinase Bud32 [Candidatus Bathyarchaeota archaeon]
MSKRKLIKKGAEASLYLEEWHGRKVIAKRRHPKKYRIPQLDNAIRSQRTRHEPLVIHKAKEAGVPTPLIYMVDLSNATIIMEFVEGRTVKEILEDLPEEKRRKIFFTIGEYIGRLHKAGIIHGDLTTSNMILTSSGKIVFVDFGLSEFSVELERRGVDLHLMKRALLSTHHKYADDCFRIIMKGYESIMGSKITGEVKQKIKEIEMRGRYVSERKVRV